ncbi:DUF397 domain-containing protein [Streptomyces sp. TS71-3]|uniref:DUF397 domain-containing protein n=1 Tax=Streptomyces sp. TS71-3 TaxID=2733862 RepID=UPI001B1D4534|nr:DUF397 domain-containing protein [Streptomyces sp. TS71-3]GHJ36435.1 toxin [Streptomyces sp. TS71-3]
METTPQWQKSTYSDGNPGGNCLELAATWQKSSFSDGNSDGDCVELSAPTNSPAHIHLRESEMPGTILTTAPVALGALITALKGKTLDAPDLSPAP